jgi:hypothetical protein
MAFGEGFVKEIFPYNNGEKVVRADPIRMRAQLHVEANAEGTSISNLIGAIDAGDKEGADDAAVANKSGAVKILAGIVGRAFGLSGEALHEDGTPDVAYALGLLDHFYEYLEKKNLPLVWRPISTPPSESISGTQTTTNTSAA